MPATGVVMSPGKLNPSSAAMKKVGEGKLKKKEGLKCM